MNEFDIKTTKDNGNGGRNQGQDWEVGHQMEAASAYVPASRELSLRSFRDEAEIHAISSALKQTGWNRKRAAQLLSISYRGLLYKIRRHNITPTGHGQLKTVTGSGDVQS